LLDPAGLLGLRALMADRLTGVGAGQRAPLMARVRHADGSWRAIELLVVDRRQDPMVGGLIVTGRDATERMQLAELTVQRSRHVALRAEVAAALAGRGGLGEALLRCCALTLQGLDDAYAAIWTLDEDGATLAGSASVGTGADLDDPTARLALAGSRLGQVAREGQPYVTGDPSTGLLEGDGWAAGRGFVACAAYPLLADGRPLGVLILCGRAPLDTITLEGLATVATATAQNLQRRRLEHQRAESEQRHRSLFAYNPDAVFAMALDGTFSSLNAAAQELSGRSSDDLLGRHFLEIIAPDDHPWVVNRFARAVGGEQQRNLEMGLLRQDGHRLEISVTALPIMVDGQAVGIYGIAKDITVARQAQATLERQALHDALSGLPNRTLLDRRLNEALASGGSPLALLLLDLDRFKEVNDTFGHGHGDELLSQVAARLSASVRATDTVARLGGDEFALLLPGADAAAALAVATGVGTALDAPFTVAGQPLHVDASIGIALYPDHGLDGPALLRQADVAMYVAKGQGQPHALYDAAHDNHSAGRLAMMADLRVAIEVGALTLYYQPKVELATGEVCGVEALVRWSHPTRGMVPPDSFIPLAEVSGLIGPLTRWVLGEAIRQCLLWRDRGQPLNMAVNLSMANLRDPYLVETIAGLLADYGVPPTSLQVEMTEGVVMADPEYTRAVLNRLRALGVGVSIDDFGAGYSSLAYLKRLPADELKVDRSFVQQMGADSRDAAIVTAAVHLGHSLGLRVVAEGVEDAATAAVLAALGCDIGQGYHYSPALPAAALERWLQARAAPTALLSLVAR